MNIRSLGEASGASLWLADLRDAASAADEWLLDTAERERAARFAFADDRRRFIAAHVALRQCLSRSTGIAPEQLRFALDARGKPFIEGAGVPNFSLSHSTDHALIGVSTERDIGVDIETWRALDDLERLADSVCTVGERRALAAHPVHARVAAFLACWTRKESCLKAVGIGLTTDLTQLEVGIDAAPRQVRVPLADGRIATVRIERVDLDAYGACAAAASVVG